MTEATQTVQENILLVCKGNICRSAAAEAVLVTLSAGKLRVRSRGTRGWHEGKGANAAMRSVALERGYDMEAHIAHEITFEDTVWASEILAFDAETIKTLTEMFLQLSRGKVRLFASNGRNVVDPYGQSEEVFHDCFDEIEAGSREHLKRFGL